MHTLKHIRTFMAAARIPRAERGHVRVGDRTPESVDTAIRQLVLTPKSCNCSLLTSPEQGTTTFLSNVGHNGLGNFCAARANTRSARNEGVATSGRKYASVIGDARAYRGIPPVEQSSLFPQAGVKCCDVEESNSPSCASLSCAWSIGTLYAAEKQCTTFRYYHPQVTDKLQIWRGNH